MSGLLLVFFLGDTLKKWGVSLNDWKWSFVAVGIATAVSAMLFVIGVNIALIGIPFALISVGVAVWLDGREGKRLAREAKAELEKSYEEAEKFLIERERAKAEEGQRRTSAEEEKRRQRLDYYRGEAVQRDPAESNGNSPEETTSSNTRQGISDWKTARDQRYAAAEAQREAYLEEEKTFKSKLWQWDVPPRESFESLRDIQEFSLKVQQKIADLESYQVELKESFGSEPSTDQSRRLLRVSKRRGELQKRLGEAQHAALPFQFASWLDTCLKVQEVFGERVKLSQETELQVWLNTRERPSPQPYGVSHEGAEHLVAEWLTYLGETNVEVTQFVGDGGVDVESDHVVCQVKNYGQGGVSSSEMRDLFGTATAAGKLAILFTSSRLTQDALDFAQANSIPCVFYDAGRAILEPLTEAGARFLSRGHYEH